MRLQWSCLHSIRLTVFIQLIELYGRPEFCSFILQELVIDVASLQEMQTAVYD